MTLADERKRRILTTHTGSLPRPDSLTALLHARSLGDAQASAALPQAAREAVTEVIRRQCAIGVDIVSDGEQAKNGFQNYIVERLTGVERIAQQRVPRRTRENSAFPGFYKDGAHAGSAQPSYACAGPIRYQGAAQLASDLETLKQSLAGRSPTDVFVPAVSPSSCVGLMENRYYKTEEEHLYAVADALSEEYRAIVAAGFQVQIDDPRLAMQYMIEPDKSVDDIRAWARKRVEALNHALRGIPPERVRHHTCYGVNMGPRTSDIELKHIVDIMLSINAGAYSFELANPRHEHEWRVWEQVTLPDDKVLIPGCISHTTVLVEHPELVAERIVRLAKIVGRERVMASTDCGFASSLTPGQPPEVETEIVWTKFTSLVEGARLATKALWGR